MTSTDDDISSYESLPFGALLQQLRGHLSLREVHRQTRISNLYLSRVEKGEQQPGLNVLRRLAAFYNVDLQFLVRRAGLLDNGEAQPPIDEEAEVERAYRFVLADPVFRFGTRPRGPLTTESKRFIVEMYERFSGKRLLG